MSSDGSSPAEIAAITSPVMQQLYVADVGRSAAYYRDVLGFEVREPGEAYGFPAAAEVVRGPARIQLGAHDPASADTREPARVLFFQAADVAAMRAAIHALGGRPSELERVNWIKMRMFEVRDPDGHTLWFGQSYQEPGIPASARPMMRTIMPALPLDDVPAGVAHYRDVLGFSVNYQQHDLGVMDRDSVRLLLVARTARHTGIGSASVYVRDADALHAELAAKGAKVQGEPISHPWGIRDFTVLDPEGNEITFGQTFE